MEEWANLLQVAAVSDVLEVGAVFHASQVRALSLADDCWATLLGQLVSRLGVERAESIGLQIKK